MCRDRRGPPRGFTLIELMIVVAVVALLAVVAFPSYQEAVRKARRTEAKAALSEAAQLMERYLTEKGTYATATLGTTGDPPGIYRDRSENGHYALSLSNQSASTFTLSAVPQGSQAADDCGTYTLTQRGERGVSGRTPAECW